MGGKDQLCSTDKATESKRCGLFCELTFQTRADRMVTPGDQNRQDLQDLAPSLRDSGGDREATAAVQGPS